MLDWLAETWNDLQQFLYSIVLTVQSIFKDMGIFFFESFLEISLLAVNGLDSFFFGFRYSKSY
jgi:hypothetical protein